MKKLIVLLLLFTSISNTKAQWAKITFHKFTVISTNDFDGEDEVKVRIGNTSYELGSFKNGQSISLAYKIGTIKFKNRIEINFTEKDVWADDHLKTIYVDSDDASYGGAMTGTIRQGIARTTHYEITYTVSRT